jgi:hypothetical protein
MKLIYYFRKCRVWRHWIIGLKLRDILLNFMDIGYSGVSYV